MTITEPYASILFLKSVQLDEAGQPLAQNRSSLMLQEKQGEWDRVKTFAGSKTCTSFHTAHTMGRNDWTNIWVGSLLWQNYLCWKQIVTINANTCERWKPMFSFGQIAIPQALHRPQYWIKFEQQNQKKHAQNFEGTFKLFCSLALALVASKVQWYCKLYGFKFQYVCTSVGQNTSTLKKITMTQHQFVQEIIS